MVIVIDATPRVFMGISILVSVSRPRGFCLSKQTLVSANAAGPSGGCHQEEINNDLPKRLCVKKDPWANG